MAPKISKKKLDDYAYEVSRYSPRIKTIFQDSINGVLDPSAFSSVKGTGSINSSSVPTSAKTAPVSLRQKTNATTTITGTSANSGSGPKSAISSSTIPSKSVILFVIGGITYSEIRSAYEVAESSKRETYIGKKNYEETKNIIKN